MVVIELRISPNSVHSPVHSLVHSTVHSGVQSPASTMAMLSLSKLNSAANLPLSIDVRETNDQGRGIFTKESIRLGKRIFASLPYSFGIGGITVEKVRALCHHCLCKIRSGNPVVCKSCKVIGYCSRECLAAALPLHKFECKGVVELEKLRGEPGLYMTTERDDLRRFWPPNEVLLVARAINKQILHQDNVGLSIQDLAPLTTLPLQKGKGFNLLKQHVRYLIPSNISDDEIYQTFRRTTNNSAKVESPRDVSATAIYLEYSLINHMCKPNCGWEEEYGKMWVFALQDIEPNSQLGISYLSFRFDINLREIRRQELKESFGFDCSCYVCLEEEKFGSKYWLLDQKKRSLIAPWSRQWADKVMKSGWEKICQSRNMNDSQAIRLLELAMRDQVVVLDKVNIILILTVVFLLYKCSLERELCRKAISHFNLIGKEGMNALFVEYGTMTVTEYVALDIKACCEELGYTNEAEEISNLMMTLFPKIPSGDKVCDIHWEQGLKYDKDYLSTVKRFQDDMIASSASRKVVTPQQVSSYVAKLCHKISKGQ